jgi:hypothetical protein
MSWVPLDKKLFVSFRKHGRRMMLERAKRSESCVLLVLMDRCEAVTCGNVSGDVEIISGISCLRCLYTWCH